MMGASGSDAAKQALRGPMIARIKPVISTAFGIEDAGPIASAVADRLVGLGTWTGVGGALPGSEQIAQALGAVFEQSRSAGGLIGRTLGAAEAGGAASSIFTKLLDLVRLVPK